MRPYHPSRRDVLAGLAVAAASASPSLAAPGESLRDIATQRGIVCGAALDAAWLGDRSLLQALSTDCNTILLATAFNWDRIWPNPDLPPDFWQADAVYKFARGNNQLARGHCLAWNDGNILPAWVKGHEADMTSGDAERLLTKYIQYAMQPLEGKLIGQDVVNEPIDHAGLQSRLWFRKLGEEYIDISFHAAAEADPSCDRTLNQDWIELGIDECELRRTVLLKLLERLLKRGVPIQTLGIEGHLDSKAPFSEKVWRRFLDEVQGMGLKVLVTEYDVNDHAFSGDAAARDAQSAALLEAFLSVTLSYPNCTGIISQSWSDRYSWYDETKRFHDDGSPVRPNPLDRNFRPKPQYEAVLNAVKSAPGKDHHLPALPR